MKKRVFTKKKIDAENYANVETGESLGSEVEFTSVNVPTDKYVVGSDEYIIIDSKARQYVESLFNNADCGRIFQMVDMVYGCYNLLCNKHTPHTRETLTERLDYSRNKMTIFMKKLYKNSVIHYMKGWKDGKECTWIMLNPTFARKQKTFHEDCMNAFEDLSKKEPVIKL